MANKAVRLKKKRLTCGIKNCRERISRYITKSGDFQGTPNLCDDCLEKAYTLIGSKENVPSGFEYGEVYVSQGTGKKVRVKAKKLICAVKGCGNRTSWYISAGGDFYGSPNICYDCLSKAYKERFQSVDLSGVEIEIGAYDSSEATTKSHPTLNADGAWVFTNTDYYLNASLFKAGDVVSLKVEATQTAANSSVTVNDTESSFVAVTSVTISKTTLTKPIKLFGDLGTSFTVTVLYADIAEGGVSTQAAEEDVPVVMTMEAKMPVAMEIPVAADGMAITAEIPVSTGDMAITAEIPAEASADGSNDKVNEGAEEKTVQANVKAKAAVKKTVRRTKKTDKSGEKA